MAFQFFARARKLANGSLSFRTSLSSLNSSSPKPLFFSSTPKPLFFSSSPKPLFSSSPKPFFNPQKPLFSASFTKNFSHSSGSKSVLINVVESFDFENMDETVFDAKTEVIVSLFPQINGSSMRRTVSKYIDHKRESYQNFFYVEVCVVDCVPIYPLISLESTWCLGVRVKEKIFVFDDEAHFSKFVAPHLGLETDICYLKDNFSADWDLSFYLGSIKAAVKTVSRGYTHDPWFMRCLALVYWVVVRSAVSPKMKEFVCDILENRYSGNGNLPTTVTSIFCEWGELSKWYMNGGIGEKFVVAGLGYDMETVKSIFNVVNSKSGSKEEKHTRSEVPPEEKKVLYNPSNRLDNERRKLEEAQRWELRDKEIAEKRRKKEEEAKTGEEQAAANKEKEE